jgi:hypothetical protein
LEAYVLTEDKSEKAGFKSFVHHSFAQQLKYDFNLLSRFYPQLPYQANKQIILSNHIFLVVQAAGLVAGTAC